MYIYIYTYIYYCLNIHFNASYFIISTLYQLWSKTKDRAHINIQEMSPCILLSRLMSLLQWRKHSFEISILIVKYNTAPWALGLIHCNDAFMYIKQNWYNTTMANKKQITYHQNSNVRRTLEGNKIVDHSDVVGTSPVGAAPNTSSFST